MSSARKAPKPAHVVPTYDSLPEMVTPEEARLFLRVSRNAMYDLLRTEKIPCVRFGRLIRIRRSVLVGESS